jgi:mannose-6-phosphate isomerase-like protein (cupin superfamily)
MIRGNVNEKLARFNDHWNPRIIASLNGQHVKVAKLLGEFPWHQHENEDEMFLVLKGVLHIETRDKKHKLNKGDFLVIPKKTEHRPIAHEEVEVMLFEPETTLNTGDQENKFTKNNLEKI